MGSEYDWLKEAIEEYGDMVYRIALSRTKSKENSEDVFQEVFIKLAKKGQTFETKEHEKAWLIRVTINTSKNLINCFWNRNRTTLEEELKFETPERFDSYFAVLKLPSKYRMVVYLFYFEGYKIREIASILKTKEATVKTQLARAKERLKVELKGEWEDE